MKTYERFYQNAEKPHIEARNWTDPTNEEEMAGNVLEKPSQPICGPLHEKGLPGDGNCGLFV